MCTSIAMQQGGGIFGRNLDLECSFGEEVAVMPRRFPLTFRRQEPLPWHLAMVGMAHVAEGVPLYAEAVNEAGLYMAGLYFPENAWYPPEAPAGSDAVTPYELIPWVLGQCKTLAQAKEQLQHLCLLGIPVSASLPLAPLHWHLADGTGAAVLEATREGVHLYDDPVGVLTNNPPFPFHQMNLRQYRALSARPVANHLAPGVELKPFGQGFGGIGLPGDASPASRYVRAAFYKFHSPDEGNALDHVTQFFHLLEGAAMVRGSVITPAGKQDMTVYSCCWMRGVYYYKTYSNSRITAVGLQDSDLDSDQLRIYPLRTEQDVYREP